MPNAHINRFEWLKAVLQFEDLSPSAKTVASALAVKFANDGTAQINPSVRTLAAFTSQSIDTIKRAVKALVDAGWMERTEGRGRGNKTRYTLLSRGEVVQLSGQNKRCINPPSTNQKGAAAHQKESNDAPSYNKDKQSLEQTGGRTSHKRPDAISQFANRRFYGNGYDGPRLIPSTDHFALNEWNAWLTERGFPKLHQMPIKQLGEKRGNFGFWLPSKMPPQTDSEMDQARFFFEALCDWEVAAHAAQ